MFCPRLPRVCIAAELLGRRADAQYLRRDDVCRRTHGRMPASSGSEGTLQRPPPAPCPRLEAARLSCPRRRCRLRPRVLLRAGHCCQGVRRPPAAAGIHRRSRLRARQQPRQQGRRRAHRRARPRRRAGACCVARLQHAGRRRREQSNGVAAATAHSPHNGGRGCLGPVRHGGA